MRYNLVPLLFFIAMVSCFSQEDSNSETDEYSEYRNQIAPPPAKMSSPVEFDVIKCDDCKTLEEKKLYFDNLVFNIFIENITKEDLEFLKKINVNYRISENYFLEFDHFGNLIKDKSQSFNTIKKERGIIDSLLHKFPKLEFDQSKLDSTKNFVKIYSKIDYLINQSEDGTLNLIKFKHKLSNSMLFREIDEFPVYSGCKPSLSNQSLKQCMNKKVIRLISENFSTKIATDVGLGPGRKRIFVNFTINKTGEIEGIIARGPHPALEKEAKRVIGLIPKFDKPGYYGKDPVNVKYSIPIVFQISE